jgi:hypothetical protein
MTSVKKILAAFSGTGKNEIALIEKAYTFADKAHEGHKRKSGEPYMIHTTAVAEQLAAMGMGPRTIAAGLTKSSSSSKASQSSVPCATTALIVTTKACANSSWPPVKTSASSLSN